MAQRRFLLNEDAIPTHWYNLAADLPSLPPPPLHPGTGQPIGPDDLAPLFPMSLILQEVSTDRWIEIPDPVREVLSMWRPTPLYRALGLEQALGTPCKIFYKYEGVSPAGSHKPNSSVPQAYYNKVEGITRLATETGAGQWGSALSFACARFGLECKVYMVRASYDQKPYRRSMIHTWGADVVASPSPDTEAGRAALAADPSTNGSLGLAISEAVEDAVQRDDTHYALGSVLNHVLLHQTVVGQEARKQLDIAGADPDVIVGCVMAIVVAFFIVVACAATIFKAGVKIETAADAAMALTPLVGEYATGLFAVGLFNASIFAACVLPLSTAYYICEGMGWELGVDKDFREAPQFFWLFTLIIAVSAGVILWPEAPLIGIMYISQVVNGAVLPFVLIFMLRLINDKRLMGDYVNGPVFNAIAWGTVLIVMGLTLVMTIDIIHPGFIALLMGR